MCHSEWSQSNWRVFLLVDFIFIGNGHYRRKLHRLNLWHCWGCVVWGLLPRSDGLWLWHSIWNILLQKANIVRHPWHCLVDKMMEWLEIQSFLVYMGNWKHWCEKVPICVWWIWVGWSKPLAHALWCGDMHLLCMHFFKGENLLFLECQSRSAHVVIMGSNGYCPSIVKLSFP